jgi:hypothetical protein
MLYCVDNGYIDQDYIPHRESFISFQNHLSVEDMEAIDHEIASLIDSHRKPDGDVIFCSSWIVQPSWEGSALQKIYDWVGDEDLSAKLYGIVLWRYLSRLDFPVVYSFRRIQHLGEDQVIGLTYWLMREPPPFP